MLEIQPELVSIWIDQILAAVDDARAARYWSHCRIVCIRPVHVSEDSMQLTMTFDEVIALATASSPLPPVVRSLSAEGDMARAEIDPLEVITGSLARIVAAAAGTVSVVARFAGFSDGVASFEITAMARGLPAHKLLPLLLDRVNTAIAENPSVAGIVTIENGTEHPLALIDLQRALSTRVQGMRVTGFDLRDATIHLDAAVS